MGRPYILLFAWSALRTISVLNTLRPRHNVCHFTDDIFKCIFLSENVWIPIKISLKFVPRGPINYIQALVQKMAWRRPGDKPLSEPMVLKLRTHICVTRPQWVKTFNEKTIWLWRHSKELLFKNHLRKISGKVYNRDLKQHVKWTDMMPFESQKYTSSSRSHSLVIYSYLGIWFPCFADICIDSIPLFWSV